MEIMKSYALTLHGQLVDNYSMHKQFLFARLLSVLVAALAACSICLAVYSGEVGLGVLTNFLAVCCPFLLYFSYKNKSYAIVVLRMQNMIGVLSVVVFLIVDSLVMENKVKVYRYCFGDLTDYCTETDDDDNTFDCRAEFDSTIKDDDSLTTVDCDDQATKAAFISALALNLVVCGLLVPYLMVTSTIRSNLHLQYISGVDIPEDFDICSRECKVIIKKGLPLTSDTECTCVGVPIDGEAIIDE